MPLSRRKVLAAGAAAAATAAVPRVLAQQSGTRGTGKFYERPVRIYYEEAGSGFPVLLLPGGGLNSTIAFFTGNSPFNAIEEFKGQYCVTADLRNAPGGQSTGPVEVDRPWESYADGQLGLMDHLGIDKFMVMGSCLGGPFIGSLLKRAPDRIPAAVMAQPVGWRPEMRDPKYPGTFWKSWGPALIAKRPEITMQTTDQFVTRMFETNPDFLFTVTRDFVRSCQNPILVLPDDVPAHPLAVAMECAMLAPKSEVSIFPWKELKERIPLAVRQIHSFLPQGASARLGGAPVRRLVAGREVSFAGLEVGTIERRHTPAHRIAVSKPYRLDVRPHDGVAGQRTMMAERHRAARDVGGEFLNGSIAFLTTGLGITELALRAQPSLSLGN